jgi:ferrous iron transport protein A
MNNMNKEILNIHPDIQNPNEKKIVSYAQTNCTDILFDFPELNVGDTGFVGQCEGHNQQRLMILGLTPGTPFSVVRVAPLGDPVEISFRGFSLTLRRDELKGIKVTKS